MIKRRGPRTTSARIESLERRELLSIAPLGGEFRANTFTASYQLAARVAAADDGRFALVWASTGQAGPAAEVGQDVYARIYDPSGNPLGDEFLVNTTTANHQALPSIAMDDNGDFVVVWHSQDQDGNGLGIYGQRVSASGALLGDEFRVNQHTSDNQAYPTVAMDADGDFVVAWQSDNQDGNLWGVFARRYDALANPLGDEFRVSNTTLGEQSNASVAMSDGGDFVVTWSSDQNGTYDVFARPFASSGAAQDDEQLVNTYTTSSQQFPWVAMDAQGDYVVAWQSSGQDTNLYGVYAQRFSAGGARAGGEIPVNTYVPFTQDFPSIAMDDAGNFLVVWESLNQDGSHFGVYGQAFQADGTRSGSEFRANTYTSDDQSFPAVAIAGNGEAVVAWQSRFQDGSQFGVYVQRYQVDLVAPAIVMSQFRYQTAPHALGFTFSEDVSASLDAGDVSVVAQAGGELLPVQLSSYDSITNTAIFTFPTPPGGVIPEGRYRATIIAAGVTDAAGNPLGDDVVFDFHFLTGDANNDGSVNLADFNVLASNFGQSNRTFDQGDFNYDAQVNLADFNILAGKFGTALPPGRFGVTRIFAPATASRSRIIDVLAADADA